MDSMEKSLVFALKWLLIILVVAFAVTAGDALIGLHKKYQCNYNLDARYCEACK